MIKDDVFAIGLGLGGEKVGCLFQQRNYKTYLINGSIQDNEVLAGARNILTLEGYDGLAGDRKLAYNALRDNKEILKKVLSIKERIVLLIATGGGTTGSGCITHLAEILCSQTDKVVCTCLMMPRVDEPIQKRLNAYNAAKELMGIPELGASIFIDNTSGTLETINKNLVKMLDAFFSDNSRSKTANFDNSEKIKMLSDHGAFVIAMRSSKEDEQGEKIYVTTQDMINSLTARNIFLQDDGNEIVAHIGIINQENNHLNEREIIKAIGIPENVFLGDNGAVNIVCLSGMGFPVKSITRLGKSAQEEQKQRMEKKKAFSVLDDLEEIEDLDDQMVALPNKSKKRRQLSLDLLDRL